MRSILFSLGDMEKATKSHLPDAETRVLPADGAQLAGPASSAARMSVPERGSGGGGGEETATATRRSEESLEQRKAELLGMKEQWWVGLRELHMGVHVRCAALGPEVDALT